MHMNHSNIALTTYTVLATDTALATYTATAAINIKVHSISFIY